jgi:hypothetical protein
VKTLVGLRLAGMVGLVLMFVPSVANALYFFTPLSWWAAKIYQAADIWMLVAAAGLAITLAGVAIQPKPRKKGQVLTSFGAYFGTMTLSMAVGFAPSQAACDFVAKARGISVMSCAVPNVIVFASFALPVILAVLLGGLGLYRRLPKQ